MPWAVVLADPRCQGYPPSQPLGDDPPVRKVLSLQEGDAFPETVTLMLSASVKPRLYPSRGACWT